jgi:hypothetical protein
MTCASSRRICAGSRRSADFSASATAVAERLSDAQLRLDRIRDCRLLHGFALATLGLLTLTWLLATRARVRALPRGIGFAESLSIYRGNLEHRTWLSTRYLRWYVLLMVPGSVLLIVSHASQGSDAVQFIARFPAVGVAIEVFLTQMQNSVGAKYRRRAEQLNLVTELQ